MRVAQRMVTRNYLRSLNNSLESQAKSLERQTSGLKFSRLSDNVSDGVRAMRVQEYRQQAEQQLENVKDIQLKFKAMDSNMDSIESILQNISEKVLKAINDSGGETNREVLAQEISAYKEQILQFCNAQYAGEFMFSGTNNAGPPFTVDDNTGKLCYNGIAVDNIYYQGGKYWYNDALNGNTPTEVPHSGEVHVDVGFGLSTNNGLVDPRTAFQTSLSGLLIMGSGAPVVGEQHGTSVPGNLYDLLTDLEQAIISNDKDKMDDMHTQLVTLTDNARMARTELGSRMGYLERIETGLINDIDNYAEMESNLISISVEDEAVNMKMLEYAWLATLQLGNMILPSSLLDYIR